MSGLLFRQLFDPETSTYTYLVGDRRTREAILVDSVREQVDRDLGIASDLGLRIVIAADTHVHADHITGAGLVGRRVGAKVALSRRVKTGADIAFDHGDELRFGHQVLEVRATPGHTSSCCTLVSGDLDFAMTGDALLIRGCGRTDFQEGDARQLYRAVHDQIFSLPDETAIYPGHDYKGRTVSTVREERLYNPRLGYGKSEDEFVAIMNALGLPYPKKIDVAVPANLGNGLLDGDLAPVRATSAPWGDLPRRGTGAPQVTVEWVAGNTAAARVIDVREPDEFRGALGHISGATLVPMDGLTSEARGWDRQGPLVLVCRSGGRSDAASRELEAMGFRFVASMSGGMVRWNECGFPTENRAVPQG